MVGHQYLCILEKRGRVVRTTSSLPRSLAQRDIASLAEPCQEMPRLVPMYTPQKSTQLALDDDGQGSVIGIAPPILGRAVRHQLANPRPQRRRVSLCCTGDVEEADLHVQ